MCVCVCGRGGGENGGMGGGEKEGGQILAESPVSTYKTLVSAN